MIGLLRFAVIAGNVLFVLWMLYNGINEGFAGTCVEKASYVGLTVLLGLNTYLILRRKGKA